MFCVTRFSELEGVGYPASGTGGVVAAINFEVNGDKEPSSGLFAALRHQYGPSSPETVEGTHLQLGSFDPFELLGYTVLRNVPPRNPIGLGGSWIKDGWLACCYDAAEQKLWGIVIDNTPDSSPAAQEANSRSASANFNLSFPPKNRIAVGSVGTDRYELTGILGGRYSRDCEYCSPRCGACLDLNRRGVKGFVVEVPGLTNDGCSQCADVAGVFVLDEMVRACVWRLSDINGPCGLDTIELRLSAPFGGGLVVVVELGFAGAGSTPPSTLTFQKTISGLVPKDCGDFVDEQVNFTSRSPSSGTIQCTSGPGSFVKVTSLNLAI